MKNQSKKQLQESISKHDKQFIKIDNSTIRNALKREINAYLQNKKQNNINNELRKLKLAKLTNNNNISEKGWVNSKKLNAYPVKTLRQIAKLGNINTNLSKGDIIYALIRSEPIVNEKRYIIESNNDIHNKINNIRLQLIGVSPCINKKNIVILEKDYMRYKKLQKLIDRLKISS